MANPKLEVEISAKLDNIDREFARLSSMARETTSKVEASFANSFAALKTAAGGLAGVLSVEVFKGMIEGSFEIQDHLNDLSKSTALSVETLAGLGAAAKKSGSDLDAIADSVRKLSINMGKEPDKYKAIGIAAKDPIEAFKQLADIYNAIEDPQERAAFAAAALGKSWAGAAPLLAEGSKWIGETVEKGAKLSQITTESATRVDAFNDRLADLSMRSAGVKNAIVNNMIDPLSQLLGIIERYQSGKGFFATLSDDMTNLVGSHRIGFDKNFASVGVQIDDLKEKLTKLQTKKAELESSSGGWLNEFLIGGNLPDINRDLEITKNQLAALTKYKDKIIAGGQSDAGSGRGKVNPPNVRAFLDGDKVSAKATKEQVSDGERLIAQLKDRLTATEGLTEAEKLAQQFSENRYKNINEAEKATAMALAEQIDKIGTLKTLSEQELDARKENARAIEQENSTFQSLRDSTEIGKTRIKAQQEALVESRFLKGEIDKIEFDQIIDKIRGVGEEGKDTFKELQAAIDGWGKQSASAIVDFAMTGKSSFSDMANSIIADMAKMVIQQNVTGPLATAFGGWAKGLFSANADGGVYSSPSLSAYSGTIVSKPTIFPFAKGIGLMGEAGDEGIFPLKRGADGKLGISASGVGGGVIVNVIESPGSEKAGTTQTRQDAGGKTVVDVFVEKIKGAIAQDIGSGGQVASALEAQYALNRSAGAWR